LFNQWKRKLLIAEKKIEKILHYTMLSPNQKLKRCDKAISYIKNYQRNRKIIYTACYYTFKCYGSKFVFSHISFSLLHMNFQSITVSFETVGEHSTLLFNSFSFFCFLPRLTHCIFLLLEKKAKKNNSKKFNIFLFRLWGEKKNA
jgi:hypothetical protein